MKSGQIAGAVSALFIGALMGQGVQGAILTTPTGVVASFEHSYSVAGKGTLTTRIQDEAVLLEGSTWSPIWQDPVTWVTTLSAPTGYKFVVTPAVGFGQPTNLSVNMTWQISGPVTDYTVYFGDSSLVFDDLAGTTPTAVSSSVVGQGLYVLSARTTINTTDPFSFTSLTFTTTPPFDLGAFPNYTYSLNSPTLTASVKGDGSLPDTTLISLQAVPEPASLAILGIVGLILIPRRK